MKVLAFGLVLLCGCAGTGVAQRAAVNKAVPTGVVTGHVFCGDTNGPARLATVMLEPAEAIDGYAVGGSKSTSVHMSGVQTMPDGSFSMLRVAPGTYYVFASEAGYVSPLATLAATREDLAKPDKALKAQIARAIPRVTVQANMPAAIDVTLERGAAVSGTVLYDDGSPAVGLAVKLLVRQKGKSGDQDKWIPLQTGPVQGSAEATTDDRGTYRIASLPAREYLLAVQLSLSKSSYDVSGGGYSLFGEDYTIPIYSGSKLRQKDATPMTLKLGEERPGEDVLIPLGKLHAVSGVITAARDGHTVNSGNVSLVYADDKTEAVKTKLGKDETSFSLSFVPEGDYLLRVADGADVVLEEIANAPGTVPPTRSETHTVHSYGPGEQPLHVDGDVSGLAVAVPELAAKKAQASL